MPSFLRCVGLPATSLGFSGSDPHTVEAFSASSCDVPDGRLAVECISQPAKNRLIPGEKPSNEGNTEWSKCLSSCLKVQLLFRPHFF